MKTRHGWIHIIGIAGHATSALALELHRKGFKVTGSDQNAIFPPVSTLLASAHIPINQALSTLKPNQVIVGSSYTSFPHTKQEYSYFLQQKIPIVSFTKYIAQHLIQKNNIVVTGAWGKTTITALLVWLFKHAGYNPSYMFGTPSVDIPHSLELNDQDWSIVEGDESIHGLDTMAKFLYYQNRYVIISSTHREHLDCYPTDKANLASYELLVKNLPKNGALLLNYADPNASHLAGLAKCPVRYYNQHPRSFQTTLLGQFNQENIDAAYQMASFLAIPTAIITKAIASFSGLKRRLEIVARTPLIIDDFAQSAYRIKQALDAIHTSYPTKTIKVFFEPHASFLQTKEAITHMRTAFYHAQEVILAKLSFGKVMAKDKRVTFSTWQNEVGDKLIYYPLYADISKHYKNTLVKSDILVHFSSGGLAGHTLLADLSKYYLRKPLPH